MKTKAEQETILRYDQDEKRLHLFTAWAGDMRRWQRLGYPIQVASRDRQGQPQG